MPQPGFAQSIDFPSSIRDQYRRAQERARALRAEEALVDPYLQYPGRPSGAFVDDSGSQPRDDSSPSDGYDNTGQPWISSREHELVMQAHLRDLQSGKSGGIAGAFLRRYPVLATPTPQMYRDLADRDPLVQAALQRSGRPFTQRVAEGRTGYIDRLVVLRRHNAERAQIERDASITGPPPTAEQVEYEARNARSQDIWKNIIAGYRERGEEAPRGTLSRVDEAAPAGGYIWRGNLEDRSREPLEAPAPRGLGPLAPGGTGHMELIDPEATPFPPGPAELADNGQRHVAFRQPLDNEEIFRRAQNMEGPGPVGRPDLPAPGDVQPPRMPGRVVPDEFRAQPQAAGDPFAARRLGRRSMAEMVSRDPIMQQRWRDHMASLGTPQERNDKRARALAILSQHNLFKHSYKQTGGPGKYNAWLFSQKIFGKGGSGGEDIDPGQLALMAVLSGANRNTTQGLANLHEIGTRDRTAAASLAETKLANKIAGARLDANQRSENSLNAQRVVLEMRKNWAEELQKISEADTEGLMSISEIERQAELRFERPMTYNQVLDRIEGRTRRAGLPRPPEARNGDAFDISRYPQADQGNYRKARNFARIWKGRDDLYNFIDEYPHMELVLKLPPQMVVAVFKSQGWSRAEVLGEIKSNMVHLLVNPFEDRGLPTASSRNQLVALYKIINGHWK